LQRWQQRRIRGSKSRSGCFRFPMTNEVEISELCVAVWKCRIIIVQTQSTEASHLFLITWFSTRKGQMWPRENISAVQCGYFHAHEKDLKSFGPSCITPYMYIPYLWVHDS
jgi:hypothetical protein